MTNQDHRPITWTIAASDSGGGAGIQADLRTFSDLDVHGCSVITAITAQNSQTMSHSLPVDPDSLTAQLEALGSDLPPKAIKIGALPNSETVGLLASTLAELRADDSPNVVLDPVLVTSSGKALASPEVITALPELYPHVDLLTPNRQEAEQLTGLTLDSADAVIQAAENLHAQGIRAVLIKGGHQEGDNCQDYYSDNHRQFWLSNPRQPTQHTRGTGCVLSSAIAAFVAHGKALHDAVVLANAYIQQGLRLARGVGEEGKRGPLSQAGWPQDYHDFPAITHQPDSWQHDPFRPCDTRKLGLYPVVDSLEWLEKLLPLGVKTLQLRIKDAPPGLLEQWIVQAVALGRQYNVRLYINDYWQLAIKHGAYGVHLGQEDLDTADLDAIREAGIRLGISTHSEYEWARAATLKPSYLAIGAIFPTDTKEVILVGTDNLRQWARTLRPHFPLVAIGGLNSHNLPEVLATGVGSVAVVSAITKAENYRKATASLQTLIDVSRPAL